MKDQNALTLEEKPDSSQTVDPATPLGNAVFTAGKQSGLCRGPVVTDADQFQLRERPTNRVFERAVGVVLVSRVRWVMPVLSAQSSVNAWL